MALEIVKPGLSTTVQDLGRPGLLSSRHPESGRHGPFRSIARQSAGRQSTKAPPCSRPCFMGPGTSLLARCRRRGHAAPKCRPRSTAPSSRAGPRFRSRPARRCRSAISRAARAPISRSPAGSTCRSCWESARPIALGALGGFEGRALKAGDKLPIGRRSRSGAKPAGSWRRRLRRVPGKTAELRVLAGPLLAPDHRGSRREVLRGHLEGGARGGPHRLSLPRRPSA